VVIGQANLLKRAVEGSPHADRAIKIDRAAVRCARIVRNFLALARQAPPERGRVALNQVVEDAVELIAYPLRVEGVEIQLDLDPGLPTLWADAHQLQQVVVNLVTNAQHALRGHPAPKRVTLSTRHDAASGRVRLEVSDTGPGIPPDVLSRVFEPFFTTKPAGEGTGLGLPLCKGVIESHGGTLAVESELGKGAFFRVELPLPKREPEAGAPATSHEAATASGVGRRLSVLIVDDEGDIGGLLAEILADEGHHAETMTEGRGAPERLAAGDIDFVFTDLRMPGLDGPSLYAEVTRRMPELADRFVFMTGDMLSLQTQEFLEKMNSPRLAKPFGIEDVRRVLAQLQRRRPHV
jgi:two-component system NtrC family sensor kinase